MKLESQTPIDVSGLRVVTNGRRPRRDLHVFLDYIQSRSVKRAHRDNALSKTDSQRLAKLMSAPEALEQVNWYGYSVWVDLIDRMARQLKFVIYDTEGSYAGYSSRELSYPDNYIEFQKHNYQSFLKLSLGEQEQLLLDSMVNQYECGDNEFFERSALGRLNRFDRWGCATGVLPSLDFAKIRRFLLEILSNSESGVWHSASRLIQYLKSEHPFFLIPEKPIFKYKGESKDGRYRNFHESPSGEWSRGQILEKDADAFKRVEGRFVERFLEGIPLIFRYVDVAYGKEEPEGVRPSLGHLKAYRINERLVRLMRGAILAPKVTVQPNFEVHVESLFYPIGIVSKLRPLSDIRSEDSVIIFRLQKQKVAAQLATDEKFDVIAYLGMLAGNELPQNVAMELKEWTAHSESFILYQGFGLLEADKDSQTADRFTVERLSPEIRIVRSPHDLFTTLEQAEMTPIHISHHDSKLQLMPKKTMSVFPEKSSAQAQMRKKQKVTLRRETMTVLYFPTKALLMKFHKALLDTRCVVVLDDSRLTLTYSEQQETVVKEVFSRLAKDDYVIKIQNAQS